MRYALSLLAFCYVCFAQGSAEPPPALQQIELFADKCPNSDPATAQIQRDFEILLDGRPVTQFPCTEPYTKTPASQYSAGTFLLQVLRLSYHLDAGRSGHLPWTNLRFYDWLKSKLDGFNIRSDTPINSCCQMINGKRYMVSAGASLDELNRDYRHSLAGMLANLALFGHEARHVDGFPHVSCCGISGGCDQRYDESNLSPYGIQYFLQRAWLTGRGLNVNLACLDPALYSRFRFNVADANNYLNRFCDAKPPALPADTVIGGSCRPGVYPNAAVGGIANVANFRKDAIAVGSAVAIFGEGLSRDTASASSLPLATALQNVSVQIGGKSAPLYFVSPGQVNVQIPYDAPVGTPELTVTANGNVGFRRQIAVLPAAPAVFVSSSNFAIAQNQDGTLNSLDKPANIGSFVTVYFTGQGLSDNVVTSGAAAPGNSLSRPLAAHRVTIGGREQTTQFIGLTPGFVGLSQVNVLVAAGTPEGAQPFVLELNGVSSPSSTRIVIAK